MACLPHKTVKAFDCIVKIFAAGFGPFAVGQVGQGAVPAGEYMVAVAGYGFEDLAAVGFEPCPFPVVFVFAPVAHQYIEYAGPTKFFLVYCIVLVFANLFEHLIAFLDVRGAGKYFIFRDLVVGAVFQQTVQISVLVFERSELIVFR